MPNILQMIRELPPLPLTNEEAKALDAILRNRFNGDNEEFVKELATEIQTNPLIANVNQTALLDYLKKRDKLGAALLSCQNTLAYKWKEQNSDTPFDDNKFMLWLISLLTSFSNKEINLLHSKLKETASLNTGTKCDFTFTTFVTAIQISLENTKQFKKELKAIKDFRKQVKETESSEVKEVRIKIAQEFKDKLIIKDPSAYSQYFYVPVKEYPHAMERLISDLFDEVEMVGVSDDKDSTVINDDAELRNLIEAYRAVDFGIETGNEKGAAQGYVSASINAAKTAAGIVASYAPYLNITSYSYPSLSLWKKTAVKHEEGILQFSDADTTPQDAQKTIQLK